MSASILDGISPIIVGFCTQQYKAPDSKYIQNSEDTFIIIIIIIIALIHYAYSLNSL